VSERQGYTTYIVAEEDAAKAVALIRKATGPGPVAGVKHTFDLHAALGAAKWYATRQATLAEDNLIVGIGVVARKSPMFRLRSIAEFT
jgi:hypothetical protein